jgi:hypothetical protein
MLYAVCYKCWVLYVLIVIIQSVIVLHVTRCLFLMLSNIYADCHHSECDCAKVLYAVSYKCWVLNVLIVIILSVIVLSGAAPKTVMLTDIKYVDAWSNRQPL